MVRWLQIRRMRRRGLTCRDFERQCDMQIEHCMIYHDPDGRVFRVQRLACVRCGQRRMTAKKKPVLFPSPVWLGDDDDVVVYQGGKLWEAR